MKPCISRLLETKDKGIKGVGGVAGKEAYIAQTKTVFSSGNTSLLTVSVQSHLGVVVVSMLATGPRGCGFEPGQGDGFLRAIKIHSTPSF
jgi:hypothetical protein